MVEKGVEMTKAEKKNMERWKRRVKELSERIEQLTTTTGK